MPTLKQWLAASPLYNTLYHFTDTRNLASVRRYGLLSVERLEAMGIVPVAPGGNNWSRTADARAGMLGYVHLCLLPEHPMEFRAKEDGRISQSLFIPVSANVLDKPGILFTNAVANQADVRPMPLDVADDYLDLQVVYTRTDWKDAAIRDRRNLAKKYEILIPEHVAIEFLRLPNG